MEIHNEILNNLNTKYVLLRRDNDYLIIDKIKKSMVILNDPIIDKGKLIKAMIDNKVIVYNDLNDLPEPTILPYSGKEIPNLDFKLFTKKLHDDKGKETGTIISALTNQMIGKTEKQRIEQIMEDYAFRVLYPGEGLNIYSNTYSDTASITVIKKINELPSTDISTQRDIYNW